MSTDRQGEASRSPLILCVLVGWLTSISLGAASAVFATHGEVRDVLADLQPILPAALRTSDDHAAATVWSTWIASHDRETRDRLDRGDEDTIVNWLMFGTSFTTRPRAGEAAPAQTADLMIGRADDLVAALAAPGRDERRLFAKAFYEHRGYHVDNAVERARLRDHVIEHVTQVGRELASYASEVAAIRGVPDASEQFALRSRVFRDRGLSLDTSLPPCFAVERALAKMIDDGLLRPGAVRDVAVIGPGLDFTDKSAGFDFYPQQTLQPFALLDALARFRLGAAGATIHLTTLDISPRVNDHVRRARMAARTGSAYEVHLPLDRRIGWTADVVRYWKQFGDQVGTEVPAAQSSGAPEGVDVRTIRVRPSVALQIVPEDLDIVAQRDPAESFDLVIATNVFVYYDTLDQSLALKNIEAMVRPGGFLLSNNALLELPSSRMRSVGYQTVQYSDRADDGDHIVFYQRRVP